MIENPIKALLIALVMVICNVSTFALAGDVYVTFKAYTTEDEISEMLKSFGLPWRILQSVHFIAVTVDDDNDVKVRDLLLKQPMVENAYVVIATRVNVNTLGTVRLIDIEGGFWGVIGDDKESYYIVNLPNEFKKEGLRVMFSGKPNKNPSTRMWGTTIVLRSIEVIGARPVQSPN